MRRVLASAAVLCMVASGSAFAADASVDTAVKTFEGVAASPDKLAIYCQMSAKMNDIGDDDKKAEEAAEEMNGYFDKLGPEFEDAWGAGDKLPENSPDAETLSNALNKLDEACKK